MAYNDKVLSKYRESKALRKDKSPTGEPTTHSNLSKSV